jgi:glycosyltransferase involved in cell wall biosynthesis
MLEALACGVPVAAFPAPGALDLLADSPAGVLDADLARAIQRALDIPPQTCRETAQRYSWAETARTFVINLAPRRTGAAAGAGPVPCQT